ncbi:protein tilB homolog [Caerostris darwini]|uniref:Protein tilB homolog n=1 Tax=Caerostris darwini TaxID=1538125 RepID=A0AAV4RA58_9ARAC|nr:protein tilB homolog [Caerostris darwini]
MATITEDLLRKCAEHNECEIFSLEEVSLHQRNIEKIEHIDRWCRDLKILYLHSNLISKIGCESVNKLDFTANFIGELTSIESLQDNYNLEELYLTGNPCTDFEGYREFVIVTLPQLKKYNQIRKEILEQEKRYLKNVKGYNADISTEFEDDDKNDENHDDESKINEVKKPKVPRKLITDDGRILNANEAKLDFQFVNDEDNNCFKLDLAVFRFLDSSLLEADVQPNYVRVKVNGKFFQLLLPEEIHPDMSTCQRSQTTGHLLITMPKANGILKERKSVVKLEQHKEKKNKDRKRNTFKEDNENIQNEKLENTQSIIQSLDKIYIEENQETNESHTCKEDHQNIYIDNPEVPPLI